MKSLPPFASVLLSLLVVSSLPAAETKSTPPAVTTTTAGSPSLAGEYTGSFKGLDESTGTLRIKLKQDSDAAWVAEAWFIFEGTEVTTKMKSITVAGSKLELVFAWEVQGVAAQSKLNGELTGDVLEGKYDSTTHEGAAHGTWKLTRK